MGVHARQSSLAPTRIVVVWKLDGASRSSFVTPIQAAALIYELASALAKMAGDGTIRNAFAGGKLEGMTPKEAAWLVKRLTEKMARMAPKADQLPRGKHQ